MLQTSTSFDILIRKVTSSAEADGVVYTFNPSGREADVKESP